MDNAARFAALEDREAIRDLIARYGPLADAGDCAGAAALWTPDGVYDVGGYGEYRGRAAIRALLEGDMHQALIAGGSAHLLSPPVIELAGDRATARTYSVVFHNRGGQWEAHRVSANLWHLERTDEGWRVGRRINRLLDGSVEARALIGGG
ncbi:uncharacterized protein (TIGR02246 family) [Sphingobium sp. OAS761]|uniref:nuclear transport factor 2 family protein n=1 Tax=Sphingobium sp. OAS761 TaxID=2817901 RepID=UPI00209ED7FA|nr:nuclear transport factor 2 family protein [Sphingobium sp. OAS761]MCP1471702.1 uncharacterized protein (TIGR02246 family) [Sphingobium sp. OAS761]